MILKSLKLFLQNIQKNRTLMDTILESYIDLNILFIQEPPWSFIYSILSFSNEEGDSLVGAPNHPNWIIFSRPLNDNNDHSHVILYINTCLSYLYFFLQKDIFNHKVINCFYFFNNSDIFFMLNVYSDDHQSVLKYLKDTEVNLQNILIMAGNFNIRDSIWNSSYPFHSSHSDSLLEIADSLGFKLSNPIQQIPTQYSNNANNTNSVINLFFLYPNSMEIDNHSINPDI